MTRALSLGRDGEAQWDRLRASYALERRRGVVAVLSPDPKVLAECRRRLEALAAKLHRVVPDQRVVDAIQTLGAEHAGAKQLPVVWLEAASQLSEEELDGAWRHALTSLNWSRESLAAEGPVYLILAGPPELGRIASQRSPDLWSVAGPVLLFGETLENLVETREVVEWLHLSDLHVRAPGDWRQDIVLDALKRDLPELLEKAGITPGLVFVTGDLAGSGQKAELDGAHRFLTELLAELDLDPPRNLFLVPGNHDVDRNAIQPVVEIYQQGILGLSGERFRQGVGEILGSSENLKPYGARLEEWCAFTGRLLGPVRQVRPDRPWRTDLCEIGELRIGIASLCSAWSCGPDDDRAGRIVVGERQLREVMDELGKAHLRLVLLHHPLEWLHEAERSALTGLLRNRAHVVLHGHLHAAEATRIVGSSGDELVVLASGAAYAGTRWSHGFQAARLDPAADELELHHFTWNARDGGFWHPDPGAARGAPSGVVRLRLPVATVTAPGTACGAGEGLAARLARAAGAVHGQLTFLGLPDHAPKPNARLMDLYVPVGLTETQGFGEVQLPPEKVLPELFAEPNDERAPRVVVLGDPGSGKSTLCRYLAVAAAERNEPPAPLLLGLREYLRQGRRDGLLAFAADEATHRLGVPVDENDLVALCREGRALLLIDGLDEVTDPGDRERIRDMTAGLAEAYPRIRMVVTSRIVGYERAPLGRESFRCLRLRPFNDDQLKQFVSAWYEIAEARDPVARSRRSAELLAALAAEPRVREVARNPLFATLFALVHRYEARLPGQRAELFELCVRMLLETWPQARGQRFSELDEGRQRLVLERLALQLQEKRIHGFAGEPLGTTIDRAELTAALARLVRDSDFFQKPQTDVGRLVDHWVEYLAAGTGLLIEQEPGIFAFAHLSFMEYLAGCALLAREQAGGDARVAKFVADHYLDSHWQETLLLMLGKVATRRSLIDAVFARVIEGAEDFSAALFLLSLLREEIDLRPAQRDRILAVAAIGAPESYIDGRSSLGAAAEDLMRFSRRHGEGVRTWIRKQLASATGHELQGVLALIPRDSTLEPPDPVAARPDLREVFPILLDYCPGHPWGNWAVGHALSRDWSVVHDWAAQESLELIVWRALNCLLLNWDVGAAFQAAALGRRAGWISRQALQAARSSANDGSDENRGFPPAFGWNLGDRRIAVELRPATSLRNHRHGTRKECLSPSALRFFARVSMHQLKAGLSSHLFRIDLPGLAAVNELQKDLGMDQNLKKLALSSEWFETLHHDFSQDLSSIKAVAPKLRTPPGVPQDDGAAEPLTVPWILYTIEASTGILIAYHAAEGEHEYEQAQLLALLRVENRALRLFFPTIASWAAESSRQQGLLLALGLAQYQTTWQWPAGGRWLRFFDQGPPTNWFPAHFWHLCQAVGNPDDPSHLQKAEEALERGGPPELVVALQSSMVVPTPAEDLALYGAQGTAMA
ncbi:MAG: NACHT domain-containing protein [bacterium]|nr:NACHT domain-containing protein [bacterium]